MPWLVMVTITDPNLGPKHGRFCEDTVDWTNYDATYALFAALGLESYTID